MSMNPPPPTCDECDNELDVDGDDGACYYTGRACQGGCDCGSTRTRLCDDCEYLAQEAEIAAARAEDHDIWNCDCTDCAVDRYHHLTPDAR